MEMLTELPFLEYFLPMPLFGLVQFGRWEELLAEPAPPSERVYWTAMWRYARGLAYLAQGNDTAAKAEVQALTAIRERDDLDALEIPLLLGKSLIYIATDILNAELAGVQRRYAAQIRALRAAVDRQDSLPYMEPPYWYYPVRQSLGAALLKGDEAAKAETVYRRDLEINRENGRSLYGLMQSLHAQNRGEEAAEAARRFERGDLSRRS